MTPTIVLSLYCVLIVATSLVGGHLPQIMRMTHTRTQVVMSFVGGLMLGVGVLHLWPHSVAASESVDMAAGWTLAGLLGMFFMIRAFDFHHHGPVEDDDHDHDHDDHGHHDHAHGHGETSLHKLSWAGMTLGLALHTLMDGIALGAAVLIDSQQESTLPFYGLGVFLAIVLHKPLDAYSITSLMRASGWKEQSCQTVNMLFAMMCPVGATLVLVGADQFTQHQNVFLGAILGISAGVFLCISLSDLLPELQFHSHDRMKLSAALLAGIAVAYLIGLVEPKHLHQHVVPAQARGATERIDPNEGLTMNAANRDKNSAALSEKDAERLSDEFVATVVKEGAAFTYQTGEDYPIFPMHGTEVMPFWSSRELARQVQKDHAAYKEFKIARVDFEQFFHTLLPEMAEQGVLIGLNWSGRELLGFDQSAEDLMAALAEGLV